MLDTGLDYLTLIGIIMVILQSLQLILMGLLACLTKHSNENKNKIHTLFNTRPRDAYYISPKLIKNQ